jgi:hypothetical protein
MAPTSVPTDPAQPNAPIYSVVQLETVKEYNPVSYKAAWGVDPPWDATQNIKTWFDSTLDMSDPEAAVVYRVAKLVNGVPRLTSIALPVSVAAVVNIPPLPPQTVPGGPPINTAMPTNPITPVPVRALLPGESFYPNPFSIMVQRSDLEQAQQSAAGGFTQADRTLLQKIAGAVGVS